jgi:lactoylglutathione lyase
MIKGLYETHLFVSDINISIDFYRDVLNLELCYLDTKRKVAFFWIGEPKAAMLGLWEMPKNEIDKRHFAFRCDAEDFIYRAVDFLKTRGITPYNYFKDGSETPFVFAWIPAMAIYFNDPDGHELEFTAVLNERAMPELGIMTCENWIKAK